MKYIQKFNLFNKSLNENHNNWFVKSDSDSLVPKEEADEADDLTLDYDVRGDLAFFIERKHIINGNKFDNELTNYINNNISSLYDAGQIQGGPDNWIFFRLIEDGKQHSSHGWIDLESLEIVQWG